MENFEYLRPTTVAEAVSLLDRYQEDAKVIAGGQSLLLMMRHRFVSPRYLIGLEQIPDLTRIESDDQALVIGAMVTQRQIISSPIIQEGFGLLAQAVAQIGSPSVRNLGTLGGNLCHAELGADPPPALLALDAAVKIVGPHGERMVNIEDFFTDYMETVLGNNELLTHIRIPKQQAFTGAVYLTHSLRVVDSGLVGVAVAIILDSKSRACHDIRIVLGGVAPTPLRAKKAEAVVKGNSVTEALVIEAAQAAKNIAQPLPDAHASAEYRRNMVNVFTRRALRQAITQAQAKLT